MCVYFVGSVKIIFAKCSPNEFTGINKTPYLLDIFNPFLTSSYFSVLEFRPLRL